MKNIRLLCRGSSLSVIQANEIMSMFNDIRFSLMTTATIGDKNKQISLMDNPDPDFFTREIDEAILSNETDIGVHSAKDLPYPLPEGIEIIALTTSLPKGDALVSKHNQTLQELPKHAKIGTSSLQRKNQVLQLRPDLEIVSIRGTIEERIAYVTSGEIDALIVAECALYRLQLDHLIAEVLPFKTHPLQGNLAVTAKAGNPVLKSLFHNLDIRRNFGKVWLTGMGAGKGDLLTIKAGKVLEQADVIFYDALIDNSILNNLNAEKIYVGKRKNAHSNSQDEINELLYQKALEGKNTVRLKGGDPLVFGRGSEEFDYLKSRMVDVDIIPGITTASAAAAYLGIALTERKVASSVAYCTGAPSESIQVPDADTLVYYMAAVNASLIAKKIIAAGRKESTPAVFISDFAGANQNIRFTNLESVLHLKEKLPTPLLLIVGDTVINKNVQPQQQNQQKVLVTGNHPEKYKHLGEVVHAPVIEIAPHDDYQFLLEKLPEKNYYDWIIFTSAYAVRYFFHGLNQNGRDLRWIAGSKVLSIGKTTSRALSNYFIFPDVEMTDDSTEGIIRYFRKEKPAGKTILIPRSNKASPRLPKALSSLKYAVTPVVIYQNRKPENYRKINLDEIDMVVFSSPSCVENFLEIYGEIPHHLQTVTRGKTTGRALQVAIYNQHNLDFII